MEPPVRTSFIPKKPVGVAPQRRGGVGIVFLVSLMVFLAALAAAGGVFLYQSYLTQAIVSKSESLDRARAAFEPAVIQELIRINDRMTYGGQVLTGHVSPSSLFALLEQATLQTVRFKSIEYALDETGRAIISLDGEARSFSDVALQSDELGKRRALYDVIFDNINLDQTGRAVFTMRAGVDPSFLLYKNSVSALPPVQDGSTPDSTGTQTP